MSKNGVLERISKENIKAVADSLKDYVGLLTLILTISTAIMSFLVKSCIYLYVAGKCFYWGIDFSYAQGPKENMIYSALFYLMVAVVWIWLNVIVYRIIISENGIWYKIGLILLIIIVLSMLTTIISLMYVLRGINIGVLIEAVRKGIIGELAGSILKSLLLYAFLLSMCILLLGFLEGIAHQREKKRKETKISDEGSKEDESSMREKENSNWDFAKIIKTLVIAVLIIFVVLTFATGWIGLSIAQKQNTFKFIDENQIVLYETEEAFLVAECQIEQGEEGDMLTIYAGNQMEISKTDVFTKRRTFNSNNIIKEFFAAKESQEDLES